MKSKLLILVFAAALIFSGCSKFVEGYDVSPNSPVEVTAALLTTNAQVALFATYGGQLARTTAIWTQQVAGTDAQMIDHEAYRVFEGDVTNEWNVIYTDGLEACRDLQSDQYSAGNPYYKGIAQILEAMYLGIATDLWGDVPDKEAIKGIENQNPMFDAQEDVIKHIQALLNSAITNLSSASTANKVLPGADDLIFGGDADAWKRSANMLKARYALRIGDGAAALSSLTEAALTGTSDDMNAVFGSNGTELNTWFAFETARPGYIKMGAPLVDAMKANNDPRLKFYAARDSTKATIVYRGAIIGSGDMSASPIGPYLQSSTLPLITYVEAKFIEAEAKFANDKLGSAAAYNEAIKAHVLQVTGASDATFETAVASETALSISLEKIAAQKYVALFGQIEVYSEWRRLDMPVLTPNPGGNITSIPVRFPQSIEERLYNTNAPNITDLTKKVWWDKK